MSLTPGTHVGEYSVLGLIGTGGMGEVYRAHDPRLNRDIAIKVLPPLLLSDGEARARFHREARAVAALNHPNIVTIHEVGEHEQQPYIAFELVPGETLKERIARGPLPVREALAIAVPLAEGLRHAHESGVVHRDLKPRNIMVRPDGTVKILDFGLGKFTTVPAVNDDVTTNFPSSATEAGVILGTVGYTAPEHITGHPVDARSDQFAFGAILYELLTGRRAFDKPTAIQTMNAIIEDDPTPLAALAPRVTGAVATIVNRCLEKNPDRRFATTRELTNALGRAGDDLRSPAVRRRRVGLIAAVVLGMALLVAGAPRWPEWTRQIRAYLASAQTRIVVLPFENVGRDATGQAFSDGLAELLTTNLSGFERGNRSLLIVPATEVRRDGVKSAQDARKAFGARLVVSGSVQRSENHVRLTINLIDAVTLRQVAGKVIEGETIDVLALQDQAVTVLAEMLDVPAGSDVAQGGTAVAGAYDYYVRGRGYLQRPDLLDSVENAITLLQRSVLRDPDFALGRAALGEAYWRKYELTREPSLVASAQAEVRYAVDRSPESASMRITRGIVLRGTSQYEAARSEFLRALQLDPGNADAYRELGRAYEMLKRYPDAETTYRKAIVERPGDWTTYGAYGRFLAARRRFPAALAQFQQVLELTPDNARAHSNIGAVHLYLKHYDEAARAFEKSVSIRRTPEALSNLGTLYFNQGRFIDAARAFQESVDLSGNDYVVWGNLGSAYQWVPDRARTRLAYEKAIELATAARRVDPRNAEILADLADFSQGLERRADALRYARLALELAPNDAVVLYKVAVTYEGLGNRQEALTTLARAVQAGYLIDQIDGARSLSELRKDPAYPRMFKR